jgi:predicted TIM-barrel fold metal-dependent hydrolase
MTATGDTARWDTGDRYVVISADTHAGAALHDYKAYLPAAWHERFDEWAEGYVSPYDDLMTATAKRNWDSDFRLSECDADGVAAELLFPNTVPPFFPTTPNVTVKLPHTRAELEERWQGIRAHNRWQVDFCSLAPARRRGLAQVFVHDIDMALEEIRWAAEQGCFGGVLVPAVSPGDTLEPLFHTRYEPIWALCQDLDITVVQHSGTGSPEMPMDQPASNPVLITEMASWAQRTLPHLILAGVFERYPRLRFAPTEQGTLFVKGSLLILEAMVPAMKSDAQNRTYGLFGGSSVDELTLSPTEYVRRNCYFGASAFTPYELGAVKLLGDEHLMWGSDYPHEEGTTPHSKLAIQWAMHDLAEESVRKILAGNAARVYGFDLEALRPVAERIGPEVAQVHRELGDTGYRSMLAFGARPFEGGLALKREDAVAGA